MPKQSTPRKPKPPRNLLTIQVEDDEDFQTFCTDLLDEGFHAWLAVDEDGRLPVVDPPTPHASLTWPKWRTLFTEAGYQWWNLYINRPKPDPRSQRSRCTEAIERVIETLATGTTWTRDNPIPPLWKGRPLSRYRLADLMNREDPDLADEVCRKYATLWFIRRKCVPQLGDLAQAAWFARLTPHDMAFLKRHDRDLYSLADALRQHHSPRKK